MDFSGNVVQIDRILYDSSYYDVQNVELIMDCYDEGNIFGTAIAKQITFEIAEEIDLERQEVVYEYGVLDGVTPSYASLGTFIVIDTEESKTEGFTKVTALDYMIKFAVPYNSELDYDSGTITIADVLDEAVTQAGMTRATQTLVNEDFIVDDNQFVGGETCRDVIIAVAQISGTFATVNNDVLSFVKTTGTSRTASASDYSELDKNRETHPINIVVLGLADVDGENVTVRDETSITANGENYLVINDNPFAYTQDKRSELIVDLATQVTGFAYTSYEVKGQGRPDYKLGDSITFTLPDSSTFESYIFRQTYKSPSGLDSVLSAPSITKATVNYQNNWDFIQTLIKRTEIIVDKNAGEISSIIEVQEGNTEAISTLQQSITGLEYTQSVTGGINLLENSAKRYGTDYLWEYSAGYDGYTEDDTSNEALSGKLQYLGDGTETTEQELKEGIATVSFYYKLVNVLSTGANVTINSGAEYSIDLGTEDTWTLVSQTIDITSSVTSITFTSDLEAGYVYRDLMVNYGDVALAWSQSMNETNNESVRIGGGTIEVESDSSETISRMSADSGFEVLDKNTDEVIADFDKNGLNTKQVIVSTKIKLNKLRISELGGGYAFSIND